MLLALLLFFTSCSTNVEQYCTSDIPCIPTIKAPHERLSQYGLFNGNLNELNPTEGLLPYDLNTPLFSDYARKQRFIYIPVDNSIEILESNILNFPIGTILVKNFFYNVNDQNPLLGRTLIETRLLIRYKDKWIPNAYVWNEEQTDAYLLRTGKTKSMSWIDAKGAQSYVDYRIPSVNDCSTCHRKNGSITQLGPTIRNLNKTYIYQDKEENQLLRWRYQGYFKENIALDDIQKLPVWNDTDSAPINLRARAYLDVNCSHCHNSSGSARNSGLFLGYDQKDPYRIGVCKIPVAAGSGAGGLKYDIVPGKPDSSILLHRINSTEPEVRMPEIGRTLIHEEAVELIRIWIEELNMSSCQME
jgi:uncharacterized repeat protein (TIGR03806 family)